MGLDEVYFGVAVVLGRCAKDFTDVLLFLDGFSCCGDPETVPAPSLAKFNLMSSKEMSPFGKSCPK